MTNNENPIPEEILPPEEPMPQTPPTDASMGDFYWEQINRLEARIDNQEAINAILTQGYAEVASGIEVTLKFLASKNPEDKAELEAMLTESKKQVIEILNSDHSNLEKPE